MIIDGRWVCKLTDYGLVTLTADQDPDAEASDDQLYTSTSVSSCLAVFIRMGVRTDEALFRLNYPYRNFTIQYQSACYTLLTYWPAALLTAEWQTAKYRTLCVNFLNLYTANERGEFSALVLCVVSCMTCFRTGARRSISTCVHLGVLSAAGSQIESIRVRGPGFDSEADELDSDFQFDRGK